MPIRPDQRARYPKDWPQISHARKEAAGWKCEACGVGHLAWGWRDAAGAFHYVDREALSELGYRRPPFVSEGRNIIEIVLTVAHLDHQPENNAPDNLRAWCQRCHLAHDAAEHRRNAAKTRRAALGTPDLLDQHL